ncbi:hypothetical protein B0T25DRAFT_566682 [Lasiosphaeria hispida]|uniref:Uncharacterized protein n=1 Tax=Lasiosphaeria hispida TaxID=260671 RepID=A0AAJ0HM23_9PEZI|nr:hypothetical protein B0T25DRAFT_566682 [Lasiosphaeria hispida]
MNALVHIWPPRKSTPPISRSTRSGLAVSQDWERKETRARASVTGSHPTTEWPLQASPGHQPAPSEGDGTHPRTHALYALPHFRILPTTKHHHKIPTLAAAGLLIISIILQAAVKVATGYPVFVDCFLPVRQAGLVRAARQTFIIQVPIPSPSAVSVLPTKSRDRNLGAGQTMALSSASFRLFGSKTAAFAPIGSELYHPVFTAVLCVTAS